ncbi:MAG: Methyltransferase type 11 [Candidatus Uhrbacteria bacterium GW2011_GWE2_45_35]|uniref:Methyltransferase type 11 n=2 Tax=Candidatus Uhriibacteriota TaxID=1752732 RepID=A0A0G1JJE7_9BACT|nr:MAG: Methyltransferase type 11 [Candidatus Uhrbacteria bacterium GW2011_GWF2_44_350]KKU08027.1 MAG: Methyltransferase type 11 [Candidatus Uhrbacteria bacterium GW2011_GWE2_45_35]HBR80187.1 ubiquinone biosynthesis protein [Candidatus Uhrbacteria bacterium]HCU32087.1 ubiquinone biosynthesis protein [Candidatus Uhrbacteria bacterium]
MGEKQTFVTDAEDNLFEQRIRQWEKDEAAPFEGWNFSYLDGRWEEEQVNLGYEDRAKELLATASSGLDIGTGGGERLLLMQPLPGDMQAVEFWPPNFAVAKERLEPLGIQVHSADSEKPLQLGGASFDVIINRQASFISSDVARLLKENGVFITQQVSGDNLADLAAEFGGQVPFPEWQFKKVRESLIQAGLKIERAEEWVGHMFFKDVGALVYFLKNVPWVVPNFSVKKFRQILIRLQEKLDRGEKLVYTQKRFLIEASKK